MGFTLLENCIAGATASQLRGSRGGRSVTAGIHEIEPAWRFLCCKAGTASSTSPPGTVLPPICRMPASQPSLRLLNLLTETPGSMIARRLSDSFPLTKLRRPNRVEDGHSAPAPLNPVANIHSHIAGAPGWDLGPWPARPQWEPRDLGRRVEGRQPVRLDRVRGSLQTWLRRPVCLDQRRQTLHLREIFRQLGRLPYAATCGLCADWGIESASLGSANI
jgi:hypothetical protein